MAILSPGKAARLFTTLLVGLASLYSSADEKSLQLYEQKIKAGIVYNLLKYTLLPEDSLAIKTNKLQICLYGNDLFDGYLSPLEGRSVQQIPIAISSIETAGELTGCNVLIIHQNHVAELPQLIPAVIKNQILTISDAQGFATSGGMIELSKENEKISLHINTGALSSAGLDVQESMLKLARVVSTLEQKSELEKP